MFVGWGCSGIKDVWFLHQQYYSVSALCYELVRCFGVRASLVVRLCYSG
jgi:hypothetical protein